MIYRKYSFPNEEAYKALLEEIGIQPIEDIEQPQISFDAVPVTCILTPAIVEGDKVIEDAVLDPNYNVDIIWHVQEPKEFEQYQVWPNGIGQQIIGGWESEYEAERLAKFPIENVI